MPSGAWRARPRTCWRRSGPDRRLPSRNWPPALPPSWSPSLKHARATTVEISIEIAPPWLLVRVQDDGVGVPVERLRALRAHGLAAMRHRARGLGGQWEVQRPPAGGTRVEVRLPLERVLAEGGAAHLEFVGRRDP
ncbi:MAG: sensor histidine kinase [Steroidobacteraceae bacterium]